MEFTVIDDEHYTNSRERKVRTFEDHGIPSLRLIGFNHTAKALAPLEEHFHRDIFEFTYAVEGNMTFYAGGKSYLLTGGEIFIAFPNERHSTGKAPFTPHQIYWFQMRIDDPDNFLFMKRDRAVWMIDRLMKLPRRHFRADRIAKFLFEKIFACIDSKNKIDRIQAVYWVEVLLSQIIKDAYAGDKDTTTDIIKAKKYISEHLYEKIGMDEIARSAYLSESRFKQKFKEQVGMSPRNYINSLKIEEAKKLLLSGKSVTDTALILGFSGSDYFSVVFRRYTAKSPTDFIKSSVTG